MATSSRAGLPDLLATLPPHPPAISDYAVIGDARSVAVVSRRGSIDWLCLPDLDSEACFAALLGTPEHGRWLLTAVDPDEPDREIGVSRDYDGDSVELETTYTTSTGTVRVTETMPIANGRSDVVRRVRCLDGHVTLLHEWRVRWDYGQTRPWTNTDVAPGDREVLRAICGPHALTLHGDRLPTEDDGAYNDVFEISAGEVVDFVMTWTHSWDEMPACVDVDQVIEESRTRWADWASGNDYAGRHREAVVRSLLVLRLLTQDITGGIAAAATCSLPEEIGGERNWDYRFCWLRDAALTLEALLELGYSDEAGRWRDWLLRAVAGEPENLQIMYRLDGGRQLPERELDHLPGYRGSRPVRVGNAAVDQRQNDVLGEVMLALDLARRSDLPLSGHAWELQLRLVADMIGHWREPDRGIWEIRGEERHFTHSKIMCWAVLDCAIRAVEEYDLDGPVEHWRDVREEIREDVLTHGYDADLGSFVQYYGATHTDASLLQIVQTGFLPADDERILGTVARVRDELADGPWVKRYDTSTGVDGLDGEEHPFLACCFWLVDALARTGELETAEEYMQELLAASNDVGLLSEEYDPGRGEFTGNLPQAFSHLTLVRAAHTLDRLQKENGDG